MDEYVISNTTSFWFNNNDQYRMSQHHVKSGNSFFNNKLIQSAMSGVNIFRNYVEKLTNERVHIILISIAFYINIIFVLIHIKPLKKKCGRISRAQEIENT